VRLLYGREPGAAVFHLAASCSGCLLDVSARAVVLGVGTNLPGDPRKQNGSGCRGAQRGGIWLERCRPGAVRLRPDQNAARRGRVPFPPRPPGDAQGGHARACAQHNGRRARRGLDGAEMAQGSRCKGKAGTSGAPRGGADTRRALGKHLRGLRASFARARFRAARPPAHYVSGSDDATGGPCHRARPGRLRLAGGRGRYPSRRATQGGLPRLASPLGAGLQPAVYLRDEGSPGPWCPSEAELRRTRNCVRDPPDASRSPQRSSRSSLRSAGAPRRCSRCPAQRRERLCR
jgi:hypothetical protein